MENQKGIDFIIHTFLEYCDEEKLKVSGYEKLYKEFTIDGWIHHGEATQSQCLKYDQVCLIRLFISRS